MDRIKTLKCTSAVGPIRKCSPSYFAFGHTSGDACLCTPPVFHGVCRAAIYTQRNNITWRYRGGRSVVGRRRHPAHCNRNVCVGAAVYDQVESGGVASRCLLQYVSVSCWVTAVWPVPYLALNADVALYTYTNSKAADIVISSRFALISVFENLYSPSKHGRQQAISNANEIKQL